MQGSWGRQLWILGALGALLILGLSASAVFTIARAVDAGEELVQLSRAQRLHQDADMMHDALRADVTTARQAAREDDDAADVRRDTRAHVRRFQADIDELRRLDLPPEVDAALASLQPAQERFLAETEQLVDAVLAGRPSTSELADFKEGFDALTTAQQEVTRRLAESSVELEATQRRQQTIAVRVLVAATAVALAAWAALVLMHRQAGRRLSEALRREAEQRAMADLLQRSLLPAPLPQVPGVRLAARSLTSDTTASVGGDWYDVFPLPSGELGLVVGDVVGHDLQAATAMGQLRAAVRAFAVHEESPAAVLQRVNTVAELLEVTDMTTCLYAVVTPTNGHVRWSSAGHPNPFVVPADGGPGQVLAGDPGPPLGVIADGAFVDCDFEIAEGAFFMLYTDGLVERRSMTLSDGQSRLETITGPHAGPDLLCERVLTDMLADDVQTDDVTLLALQA